MTKPDDDHNDDVDNDEDDNDDVDHDDVDHDDDDCGTATVSNCLRRWLGGEHFADKPFEDDLIFMRMIMMIISHSHNY